MYGQHLRSSLNKCLQKWKVSFGRLDLTHPASESSSQRQQTSTAILSPENVDYLNGLRRSCLRKTTLVRVFVWLFCLYSALTVLTSGPVATWAHCVTRALGCCSRLRDLSVAKENQLLHATQ